MIAQPPAGAGAAGPWRRTDDVGARDHKGRNLASDELNWLARMSRGKLGNDASADDAQNDIYVMSAPSVQNAIDALPGWNHAFPPEMKLEAGPLYMYEDPRIHWAVEQFGPLEGKRILELGPLEASHTYLLERLGAQRIEAIEANKIAFLRCLVAKEVYNLRRSYFFLGDFVKALQRHKRYDFIIACGVLYHMEQPLLLLERMAARTDNIFIWTHYFDDSEMPRGDPRRAPFRSQKPPHDEITRVQTFHGMPMTQHLRSYYTSWKNNEYCGGAVDRHYWIEKADLIAALKALGFNDLRFTHEAPDHPNGPAMSLFARRA
jgi:hypothetical protein